MLPGQFAVCRLGRNSVSPDWARDSFVSVTATEDELSVACAAAAVPVGVLASVAMPLAHAGISLLAIATYETDYLLVKSESLDRAVAALTSAGHTQIE